MELAKTAGFDAAEAGKKVASVFMLNLQGDGGTKVASATNLDGAVHVRALQLLEKAGYPVTW